jgi:histidine ammonia-lyase
VPVAAVHAAIREQVPAMNVDREVSGQITAVDAMLAEVCETAAASCGGLG